jgi:hypothetical protein
MQLPNNQFPHALYITAVVIIVMLVAYKIFIDEIKETQKDDDDNYDHWNNPDNWG